MANQIKKSADGLALQVTKPARSAGLVEETSEGDTTRQADVWVYGFENLMLIVDADRVQAADRAELIASAAGDTDTVYAGRQATIASAGNGYQVQLPGCEHTGLELDDKATVLARSGLLVIHDGTQTRLVEDLATIRDSQVSN